MNELVEQTKQLKLSEYKQKLDELNDKRLDAILNLNLIENEINLLKWTFKKTCDHEYELVQSAQHTYSNYKKCKHCGNLI